MFAYVFYCFLQVFATKAFLRQAAVDAVVQVALPQEPVLTVLHLHDDLERKFDKVGPFEKLADMEKTWRRHGEDMEKTKKNKKEK